MNAPEPSFGALVRNRRFTVYLASRVSLILATQAISVAVGWHLYEITGKAMALALSGLALFLPGFVLALAGGHFADRHDRRKILLYCHGGVTLSGLALAAFAASGARTLAPLYAILVILGAIRAFSSPAGQALMPNLVERSQLERAIALSSSSWQVAMIAGPVLSGVVYDLTGRAAAVYAVCAALALGAFVGVFAIGELPARGDVKRSEAADWTTLLSGIRYVWSNKPILGAMSLDLFAVLVGSATALFPIFARDILHVGAGGLGALRSAPAFGASIVALAIARWPLRARAGRAMFASVFAFGLAIIGFGVSRDFWLSLTLLVLSGATDMVSVVVRSTLIQTRTPDEMRGRVGAVNLVFINASNDLGDVKAGTSAALLGPPGAVIAGGAAACAVVLVCAVLFPALRAVDRLDDQT